MSGVKRIKSDPENIIDLYTNASAKNMHLLRAFRILREHHPDFRNLHLPEDDTQEAMEEFVRQVQQISDEMRRKRGGLPVDLSDVPSKYLPTVDIEPIYNEATMLSGELMQYEDSYLANYEEDEEE